MFSPGKILMLALGVAVLTAYYGDQMADIGHTLSDSVRNVRTQQQATYKQSYADSTIAAFGDDIQIPISPNGHYWVTVDINNIPIRFMVDTGASHIILSHDDAEEAGINLTALTYNQPFKTAGGVVYKAMTTLDRLSLDTIRMTDLRASVSQPGDMNVSLLGMDFLNQLSGFSMENGILYLTP